MCKGPMNKANEGLGLRVGGGNRWDRENGGKMGTTVVEEQFKKILNHEYQGKEVIKK